MHETQAWILKARGDGEPERFGLSQGTVRFGAIAPDEALVAVLYGCWEGNMDHAMRGDPIDICAQRGEPEVVLGNAGVVRVLKTGSDVKHVSPGETCIFFGAGKMDRFGYMELAHGYDMPGTIGLLAHKTKTKAHNLIPLPPDTRFSLAQWAAFSLRYVTAWANWRMGYACYRLQVSADDHPAPHVWSWGGGTSLAELELAALYGCRPVLVSSRPHLIEQARAKGIAGVDRSAFANLGETAEANLDRRSYQRAERGWRSQVDAMTQGEGVSVFIDYIGTPLWRPVWRVMGRAGVIVSAGWKAGADITYNRAAACVKRINLIHTHYASVVEARDAVAFAERTGWMPEVSSVWSWQDIPALARGYAANELSTYFPVFQIND